MRSPSLSALLSFFVALAHGKQILHLVGSKPDSGGWPVGAAMNWMADKAIEEISKSGQYPFDVKISWNDDECSRSAGMKRLIERVTNASDTSNYHGIIGSGCSGVCMGLGEVAPLWGLNIMSWGCSSARLSDTKAYPNFARTSVSGVAHNVAWALAMNYFKWKRAGVMVEQEESGYMITSQTETVKWLNDIGKGLGIHPDLVATRYVTAQAANAESKLGVKVMLDAKVRIIWMSAYSNVQAPILCALSKAGMIGSQWIYFGYSWFGNDWLSKEAPKTECSAKELIEAGQGTLGSADITWSFSETKKTPGGLTAPQLQAQYLLESATTNDYSALLYDGIWVWANAVKKFLKAEPNYLTTWDHRKPDADQMNKLYKLLIKEELEHGASGAVVFEENGDRGGGANFMILKDDKWSYSGTCISPNCNFVAKMDFGLGKIFDPTVPASWTDGSLPRGGPKSCPAGEVAVGESCVKCEPHTYYDSATENCRKCAAGFDQVKEGQTTCNQCPLGKFTGGNKTACADCAKGLYAEATGTSQCNSCRPGTYSDKTGQSSCQRCAVGKYLSTSGGTVCKGCESFMPSSTTPFQAATKETDCVCPAGMYDGLKLKGTKTCVQCTPGQACNEAGLLHPNQAEGYYIHALKPDDVYLCEPKEACLGAKWGESVCRAPRQGFMCMDCPDGKVLNDDFDVKKDGCLTCSSFTSVIVVLVPIVVFFFCVATMYYTHPCPLDESPLTMEVQNSIGQLVMFVQVVNAIFATRMMYGEPMGGFMTSLVTHIDPDKIFTNTPCIMASFSDPVAAYAAVIGSPVVFMIFLYLAYLVGKYVLKQVFLFDAVLNICGEVLVEFYISITLAIFAPFNCYDHPNGSQSVVKYPTVLCGESEHGGMVGLSIFGILAYPLNALVIACYMTWKYPRAMMKNDLSILVRGRFLFDRWTPSGYWFCNVSLVRNFLIALFPNVLPEGDLDVTILLMTLTLMFALAALLWFKPRRTLKQNYLDAFISMVQLIVLSFGVTSVHGHVLRESLSAACVIFMVAVVFAVMSVIVLRGYQLISKSIQYGVYLSHHSGAGGTSCRVLLTILRKTISDAIFFDIDAAGNLGSMIDAVRLANNVVMVWGSESLCRPWVISALVCAHRKGIPLHTVIFLNPKADETVASSAATGSYVKTFTGKAADKKRAPCFELDTFSLRGYGVSQTDVHPALQTLSAVDPVFMNFLSESRTNNNMEELVGRFTAVKYAGPVSSAIEPFFRGCKRCAQFQEGGQIAQGKIAGANVNLILIDHTDGEAVSVSRLFQTIFAQQGNWLEDQDLCSADYATIVRGGKPLNAVFTFSQNTHKSVSQLARLGLLVKCQPEMHIVPVAVGVTFDFPDADYLKELQIGKALDLGCDPASALASAAGAPVTLKDMADGLTHVMGFLVCFVNVPALVGPALERQLFDILDRATGSGRRTSISKQVPLSSPQLGGGGGFGGGGGGSPVEASTVAVAVVESQTGDFEEV